MKSFLTIRSSLLAINLIVIALILWLAVSFLYIAVAQRRDAEQLLASVDTERSIFQANNALAREREKFTGFLNSNDKVKALQLQKLQAAGRESDAMLIKMMSQITHQISDMDIFDHVPTSPLILEGQMADLERHRILLIQHRKKALLQPLEATGPSDTDIQSMLFDRQTDAIEDLVDIAKSLKYLPDTHASAISHYHSLLSEILMLNVELARKNTALSKLILGADNTTLEFRVKIAVLSQKVDQRLENIVSLAQASDNASQLTPIAMHLHELYQEDYLSAKRAIYSLALSTDSSDDEQTEWRATVLELSHLQELLAAQTHAAIEVIAADYGTRASRNLIIDVFLVFLCFVITLASVAINRRIRQYAFYDSLTRLPNRMSFETTLRNASHSDSQIHAVLFVDLNRFKSINDNYGHSVGDELLIVVASRLKAVCKPDNLVARLGGDEFAVLIADARTEADVEQIASDIVCAVGEKISIRELTLSVGASVGMSLSPMDCECGIALLKNADIAMYHSKANKLEGAYRFNKKMAVDYQERLQLEQDLKKGLENNQFQLDYQPKVCTQSGQVKSVEALLRWAHPVRGLISPALFIPVAEDTGLMGSIGQWVLHEACREIAVIKKNTHPELYVSVNISAQQFCDEKFVESVYKTLDAHGLGHESLELEVTESMVMSDVGRVISMLSMLKDSGIKIAIDDFGTGYSSLQYLQELPLDTLKIDRAFVTALDENDPANSVANSIVQLAKLFDLDTVAEGVETTDQDLKIRSLGVHHIQGFLYSKPVPAPDLSSVLQQIEIQSGYIDKQAA
ncbi:MAG: putative bifunctional diguanylate cyclase/phosphodiesterase [Granulosicoccus sp.]